MRAEEREDEDEDPKVSGEKMIPAARNATATVNLVSHAIVLFCFLSPACFEFDHSLLGRNEDEEG